MCLQMAFVILRLVSSARAENLGRTATRQNVCRCPLRHKLYAPNLCYIALRGDSDQTRTAYSDELTDTNSRAHRGRKKLGQITCEVAGRQDGNDHIRIIVMAFFDQGMHRRCFVVP